MFDIDITGVTGDAQTLQDGFHVIGIGMGLLSSQPMIKMGAN